MVYVGSALSGQLGFAIVVMSGFIVARYAAGKLDAVRRVGYEVTALLAYYTAGQALLGLLLLHGFPRLVG